MKYLKYLFVGGFVLLTSSYTTKTSRNSDGIYPGNLIPDITLSDELGNSLRLSDFKGQKILVNLWAAYDADSHMKNVLLWNTLQNLKSPVKMVSISFDESRSVFEKSLSMDGIPINQAQFLDPAGINSDAYKMYRLEKGFKNYLIDENGVILATNITPTNLRKVLKID